MSDRPRHAARVRSEARSRHRHSRKAILSSERATSAATRNSSEGLRGAPLAMRRTA